MSPGGTNISAVGTANNHLISSGDPEHAWMMILLTDGQGSYSNYYTRQAAASNIAIYTLGLGSGVNSGLLTSIATATGGQYYSVASADQLPQVFRDISGELEPTDTDGDGIPDVTESEGFRDGYGHWYTTDPEDPDTDGDGLSDGEEAGELVEVNGRTFFKLLSDPTLVDGDGDGIDDSDEAEFGTKPLDHDSDNDKLEDGLELEIGTDPLVSDTDYDGVDDYDEYNDLDHDPLVYEKRYSILEIGRDVSLGAVLGEWYADVYDSVYYMAGWMLSGFIAVGDIRDIGASIAHGDGFGTLLNALALIPVYGDAGKVGAIITKFSTQHPHMLFTIAGFVVKHVDDSVNSIRSVYGDAIVNRLKSKGFSDDVIVTLSKQDIDLRRFDDVLTNSKIYDDFPGLPVFVRNVLTKDGMILSDRVTFNVKKMVAADAAGKSTAGYLSNLKGAYAENLAKQDIVGDAIKDLSHVNKGGLDYVAKNGNVLDIVEAKARQSLSKKNIKNYIKTDSNGAVKEFNVKYSINELGEDYFKDKSVQKRFVLYLNGPNSQAIKNSLNLPASVPYKFRSKIGGTAGQEIKGTIEIVVMAVNK